MAEHVKPETPAVIKAKLKEYEADYSPPAIEERSIEEIVKLVESGKATISAKVICTDGSRKFIKELDSKTFCESYRGKHYEGTKESSVRKTFREAVDSFSMDDEGSGVIGQDFVPLLGGPFNKQMYLQGQLKQYAECFYAFHHDPVARFCALAVRDFTLGREWRVDAKGPDMEMAQLIWDACAQANDMDEIMDQIALELCINGEIFLWELPDDQAYVVQAKDKITEIPDQALFNRFRLMDSGLIYDFITDPVDIKKVHAYQLVGPTQYQIYTNVDSTGEKEPTLKFWYEQIPASQMGHFKVNATAFEKRGRSDMYPVLSYLKRLRDAVNYSVISVQKASAWSIDTTIDGSQDDIDGYQAAMDALGTIPPAGSEFIHSTKVKREYLGAQHSGGGKEQAFEWCLSMIAAGIGIPTTYLGMAVSGQSTRASSMVATEPVVKRFETRRNKYQDVITWMFDRVMKKFGLDATCEITFPELVVQDRSAKLKDLSLCQAEGWFSKKRCAEIAALELDADDFDYEEEKNDIASDNSAGQLMIAPLTGVATEPPIPADPNTPPPAAPGSPAQNPADAVAKPQGVTNNIKRGLKLGRGQ